MFSKQVWALAKLETAIGKYRLNKLRVTSIRMSANVLIIACMYYIGREYIQLEKLT